MLNSLLDGSFWDNWPMIVIIVVMVVAVVLLYVFGSRKRKKQEKDAQDLINAVKPGNKVKTIGGICGIVVEVDNEENTFVLETGTETSGKSYMKFDRQAIYQTDAVAEKPEPAKPETKEEVPAEEPAAEPVAEEKPAEVPAEQPVAETTPAEATETADAPELVKPKKSSKKGKSGEEEN